MRGIPIAIVGAALASGAAPAEAVTITGSSNFPYGTGAVITVEAGSERNAMTVAGQKGGNGLVVRERASVPLVAKGKCERRSDHVVACPGTIDVVKVELGGADDELRFDFAGAPYVEVDGESGSDEIQVPRRSVRTRTRIRGGKQNDSLLGSERRDRLVGERGEDVLRGESGRDILIGDGGNAPPAHDVLVGGRGHDAASWGDRDTPVRADLRKGIGGTPGDEDELRTIEDLWGGAADDVLVGGPGANQLRGRGGEDELYGNDGDDVLDGGVTRFGNLKNDGALDGLHCGAGDDTVLHAARIGSRRLDIIPQDCERVRVDAPFLEVPRLALGARSVTVEIECAAEAGSRTVTLVSRGVELGRSDPVEYDHPACRTDRVEVPLDQPLTDGPPIRVGIDGTDRRSDAPPEPYSRHYRLSRPDA